MCAGNDEGEVLAVTDSRGLPTGHLKHRAEIHRDGDWHRTRTVWAVLLRESAAPALLLQKRGAVKDAWPGLLDASSAGHLMPDEPDPWREVEEELGLRPARRDRVLCLGVRRYEARLPRGRIDRELQELFLWLCPHVLCDFRPPAPEVAAVLAVGLGRLLAMLRGELARVAAAVKWAEGGTSTGAMPRLTIRPADFVPGSLPHVAQIVELAARAAEGERNLRYDAALERANGSRAGRPHARPCSLPTEERGENQRI